MLNDGLAGSERSRNGCNAALGDREECVDDPLSCDQRLCRRKFFLIRTAFSDRPFLHERQFFIAVLRSDDRDGFFHGKGTGLDVFDGSFDSVRHHDLLRHDGSFFNGSEDVAGNDFVAGLRSRLKVPFLRTVQRRYFNAPRQVIRMRLLHDSVQRTLNAVVNGADESRSQFNGQRNIHGFNRLARAKSRSLFVNLDGSLISVDLDDFTDQTLFADTNDVKHIGVTHARRDNQRSCYFFDYACAH